MSGREFDDFAELERMMSESISNEASGIDDFFLGELFEEDLVEKKKPGRKPSAKQKKTVDINAMASAGSVSVGESITEAISIRTLGYIKRLEDLL